MPDSPPDCGVPIDTTIELRFDRFLIPGQANRQSLLLYSGSTVSALSSQPLYTAPEPEYDAVERVFTFRLPEGETLEPRTLYTVELPVWGDEQPFGFRAIDGAPMGEHRLPLRFSFYTSGVAEQPGGSAPEAQTFSCSQVLEWFAAGAADEGRGNCAQCHSGSEPPMGLNLSDGNGLLDTAIGRVAHQADFGASRGAPLPGSARFGVGMPVIDRSSAGQSYLLYKLLIKPENYAHSARNPDVCTTTHRVAVGEDCVPPSADEIARLRDWFVRGEPMPLGQGTFLAREQLQALQSWIRAGAACP